MRLLHLLALFTLLPATRSLAQYDGPAEPGNLPVWMQEVAFIGKPVRYALPKREPLHSNAFTGTWSVQKQGGRRFDFWSDKHRLVIQEIDQKGERRRMYFIDLAANIRMAAGTDNGTTHFMVEDMYVPQVGYFREIWSDTLQATGRTSTILGERCDEFLGNNDNKDTTYYWRTTQHPKLFADMQVWAPWLCREGELEFLTALCSETAGPSMRASWPKRKYSTGAGSIEMVAIKPGAAPMPTIQGTRGVVLERRFLWNNNSGIGTLPAWMRAYLSDLKPEALPAAYTPAPEKRNIPDNSFIGSFTAETPTSIIGLPDKKTGRDTSYRLAKYSYWADARRAVLIMDDPDDEGYLFYAVDLDADVVMATHNEMHSYVVPRLYISNLEQVGLKEFGRGLDMPMRATEHTRKMLGRNCTLYTTNERFLSHFWIPEKTVTNPVFDMQRWMVQRMGQKMKDIMFFGVADKPMPMAVMGTHLTTYKPGKAKPPVADLRYYRVYDERLEQQRRQRETPQVEVREISVEEMLSGGYGVAEPTIEPVAVDESRFPINATDRVEASPDGEPMAPHDDPKTVKLTDNSDGSLNPPPPPARVAASNRIPTAGSGTGHGEGTGQSHRGADRPRAELSPYMEEVLARKTNQFIGTAVLEYTKTNASGRTEQWQVRYASDSTKILALGRSKTPDYNLHDRAYLIDRQAGTEQWLGMKEDSTVVVRSHTILDRQHRFAFAPAHPDSVISGSRKILDSTCEKRLFKTQTTHRVTWVDPSLPSLFQDVISARKKWGGIEIILLGNMLTSTAPGMPLEADYTYHGGDHVVMKVIELKPGPVDPKVFEVTKESWR